MSLSVINPCGHLRNKSNDADEIKCCDTLAEAVKKAKNANRDEDEPGADKAEHRVQAYLIREALRNGLRFYQAFQGFGNEFDELIFVTDELGLEAGENKLRADIIAVGSKNGVYFPVFIELKNARLLVLHCISLAVASGDEYNQPRRPFRRQEKYSSPPQPR